MSRYRKIISLILLLVFALYATHELVPHHHHSNHEVVDHHHNQSDDHDHDHQHKGHDDHDCSLACVFSNHGHAHGAMDVIDMSSTAKSRSQLKQLYNSGIQNVEYYIVINVLNEGDRIEPPPPEDITSIFLDVVS